MDVVGLKVMSSLFPLSILRFISSEKNNFFSLESSLWDIFFTFDRVVIHCTYITLIIIIDAKENFSFTKLDKEDHIKDPGADLSIFSVSTNENKKMKNLCLSIILFLFCRKSTSESTKIYK